MSSVDTTKVEGRRTLRFNSLDDISADVENLARAKAIKNLGNWTPGQVFAHLAIVMNGAIDGMENTMPWHMRAMMFFLIPFMKKKFLTGAMPAGFKLPPHAEKVLLPPASTTFEEGLASIRRGLERLKTIAERKPSPFLGNLTREQWDQLNCRHCELHLSFLVPENS